MKSISFRQLRKILLEYDSRFEFYTNKGKGSHRVIQHPDISGKRVPYPIPVHSEGADIKTPYLTKIKRDFNLPEDIFS